MTVNSSRFAVVVLLVAATIGGVPALLHASTASVAGTVVLSSAVAKPGDVVVVHLEGWEARVVTLAVCGNAARRGSRDCDLTGAQSVKVQASGPTVYDFRVTAPPLGCPCVVRVATPAGGTVLSVPIELEGVGETAPLVDTPGAAKQIRVSARVQTAATSWPGSWLPALAGPTHRTLVVTIENPTDTEVSGLRVAAVVGRDHESGEPVAPRAIAPIAAGAQRRIAIPVDLPVPAWDDYVVYGTVSGVNASLTFSASTTNDPWGLELVVPLVLLLAAQLVRRRARARKAQEAQARAVVTEPFQDCSPEVGANGEERSRSPAYDPAVHPPHAAPRAAMHDALGSRGLQDLQPRQKGAAV